jgi:phage gp46-like protein
MTDQNLNLAKQYLKECLQWLITIGRAKSFIITVERDDIDKNRMDIKIDAQQADGLMITYTQYKPVGMSLAHDYSLYNGIAV